MPSEYDANRFLSDFKPVTQLTSNREQVMRKHRRRMWTEDALLVLTGVVIGFGGVSALLYFGGLM